METRYFKSQRSGYQAESMTETDANGQAWQISTMKNSRGFVACSAIQGDVNESGIFSYMIFGAKRLELAKEETKCTEASVKRVHEAGLLAFAQTQKEQPETTAPAYVVGIGQILFTDGFDTQSRRAIYEIKSPGHFKTVLLDGSDLRHDDHVRPYSEKFGIGTYYNEGEILHPDDLSLLVHAATVAIEEREQAKQKASDKAAQERARKIEEGSKIISAIPAGVQTVIVGIRFSTSFDPNADYNTHPEHNEETVYLAWSDHTRDIFSEMRKAADKFEKTAHLGTGKGIFNTHQLTDENRYSEHGETFTTEAEAAQYVAAKNAEPQPEGHKWEFRSEKIEHREKYSMGSGYYLKGGEWKVRKSNFDNLEDIQIAAAEGRFYCNQASPNWYKAGNGQPTTTKEAPIYEAQEVKAGTVQIIDYSERAFAVIGSTKKFKDDLKTLGGKFNSHLKVGPGWIFSRKRYTEVEKFFQSISK